MKNYFLKSKILLSIFCAFLWMPTTTLFSTPPPVMVQPSKTTAVTKTKKEARAERKLDRKMKRLQKKMKKFNKAEKQGSKRKKLLTIGLGMLILGILLIAAAGGAGIAAGLLRFILGVAVSVGGIVTMIVGAVQD